jgi:hypothetical protein
MRLTEMSKDFEMVLGDGDLNPRNTDFTFYSRSSLMRASLMTIARDDMSYFDEHVQHQERPSIDNAE